jgi:hypothetical protein
MEAVFIRQMFWKSSWANFVHGPAVIVAWEQVAES